MNPTEPVAEIRPSGVIDHKVDPSLDGLPATVKELFPNKGARA
ncbi:hypothetical protein OAS67_07300 [Alphaproteobacteria bacterium]|nr:hypothetical protein [Alphaproteobacteria bacterium]